MIKKILPLCIAIALSACAEKANHLQMIPTIDTQYNLQENSSFYQSANKVTVSGGEDTNPLWTSEVDATEFQKALEASLKNANIFSSEKGAYTVEAKLISVEQPLLGFTMEVTSNINYSIIENKTKKLIYSQKIKAVGAASPSDAFIGSKRVKIANERSIKENIKLFIQDISKKI